MPPPWHPAFGRTFTVAAPPPPLALVHPNVSVIGRPVVPEGVRYALLLRMADGGPVKPLVAPSLPAFARALHRLRRGDGLSLQDCALNIHGRPGANAGVSIWLTCPQTGERSRWLGWAWLGGLGRRDLEAALRMEERL